MAVYAWLSLLAMEPVAQTGFYGSDTESNETLKVTRAGRFSKYVTSTVVRLSAAPRAHLHVSVQLTEKGCGYKLGTTFKSY